MLQPIRLTLVPQSCTEWNVDLKKTFWISLRDNAWIYMAPVPERLTVLCIGQKPTDIEIGVLVYGSFGVLIFWCADLFVCLHRLW